MRKWVLSLLVVLLVGACTPSPVPYDESPNALLIYARSRSGGPPRQGSLCNFVPNLRIWGDGRVVMGTYTDKGRQVNLGHIDKAQIEDILELLRNAGFYSNWTPEAWPPNPAGDGFDLDVNLPGGDYSYSWQSAYDPEIYRELLAKINPTQLKPFTPGRATLMAVPFSNGSGDIVQWPPQFSFSLKDVTGSGRIIAGEPLAFIWQDINQNYVPVVMDDNIQYLVWLVMPEISMPYSGYGCP
jgi:hypothetical protein